jgi:hypothetical protein
VVEGTHVNVVIVDNGRGRSEPPEPSTPLPGIPSTPLPVNLPESTPEPEPEEQEDPTVISGEDFLRE